MSDNGKNIPARMREARLSTALENAEAVLAEDHGLGLEIDDLSMITRACQQAAKEAQNSLVRSEAVLKKRGAAVVRERARKKDEVAQVLLPQQTEEAH